MSRLFTMQRESMMPDTDPQISLLTHALLEPLIEYEGPLNSSYLTLCQRFDILGTNIHNQDLPRLLSEVAKDMLEKIQRAENFLPGSAYAEALTEDPDFGQDNPEYEISARATFNSLLAVADSIKKSMPAPLRPHYDGIFHELMTSCIPANFAGEKDYPKRWQYEIDKHFPAPKKSQTHVPDYGVRELIRPVHFG